MLIGSYYHSLQAKGRLAIPAAFRSQLGDKPILTRGIEQCLYILPFDIWSKLIAGIGEHPLSGRDSRNLRRLLAHTATQIEFDDQGRIIVPDTLRLWANLEQKVVVAGSINWVEIWDQTTYHHQLETLEAQAEDVAERVSKIHEPG
jgi:MraZ protein